MSDYTLALLNVVLGMIFIWWPGWLRRTLQRVGERATAAGREHNVDELMSRRWMVNSLRLLPILGGLLIVCGLVLAGFAISG